MADEANEGWSGAVRGPIRGYRKPGSDSVPGTAGQAARVPTGLVSTSQNFPVLDSYFSVRGGPAAITGLETSRRRWRGRPREGSQHPLWDWYRPGPPASRPAPFTTPIYTSLHESILTCLPFRIYSF